MPICAVIITLRAGDFDLSIGASMGLAAAVAGVLIRVKNSQRPDGNRDRVGCERIGRVLQSIFVLLVGLPPFVTTLGMLILVEGISLWITDGQLIPSLPTFVDSFSNRVCGVRSGTMASSATIKAIESSTVRCTRSTPRVLFYPLTRFLPGPSNPVWSGHY